MDQVIDENLQSSSIFKIMPERTAITNGVSYSAKRLIEDSEGFGVALDYGAGKLRNSRYLHDKGMVVDAVDTKEQIDTYDVDFLRNTYSIYDDVSEKYDFILCSFVLNVIPNADVRIEVMKRLSKLVSEDGFIYLETRSDDKIESAKTAIRYGDGYLLGSGQVKTFQKKIDSDELRGYAERIGLRVADIKRLSASSFIKLYK